MWLLDFPEHDPDSNYPDPTLRQLLGAEQARRELDRLKSTLERLTVPQQRAIIGELSGSVFRREPFRIEPAGKRTTLAADLFTELGA